MDKTKEILELYEKIEKHSVKHDRALPLIVNVKRQITADSAIVPTRIDNSQ